MFTSVQHAVRVSATRKEGNRKRAEKGNEEQPRTKKKRTRKIETRIKTKRGERTNAPEEKSIGYWKERKRVRETPEGISGVESLL